MIQNLNEIWRHRGLVSLLVKGCGIKMIIDLGEWILVISAIDWEHSITILCWILFFYKYVQGKPPAKKNTR